MHRAFERPINVAVALIAVTAIAFGIASWNLGFWTEDGPGPGLLPFVAAVFVAPVLVLVLREKFDNGERFHPHPLIAIVMLCAYAVVLPYLGFIIPTVTLIVAWVMCFERKSLMLAFILSVLLVAVGWFIFGYLLKVPMQMLPVW